MFCEILFSPQVKRIAFIGYKHGMYDFPHNLLKDLDLDLSPLGGPLCPHKKKKKDLDLTKLENIRKALKPHRIIA